MRSSPPVLALVKVHALVDASVGRVPGFDKLAFVFKRSLSGVAGCETVQGKKRIPILLSDGAFVFLHTGAELPTVWPT